MLPLNLCFTPSILLSYLVVQTSRTRTTWSCTALLKTQIPWVAEVGWASWASTPGCQRGARCLRCTPTVTGRRVPGRQTCPLCAQPCAAERPQNNPCSVWWSPQRSLAQAWWSRQKVPHQLAARGREQVWSIKTVKMCKWGSQPKNVDSYSSR